MFLKYFITSRQYLVGMFHPRRYARRLVSPFLTGLHLIDNFPLRSPARLPHLSIVLDNVDESLTTVVVCFDKYNRPNLKSEIFRIGSLPSGNSIPTRLCIISYICFPKTTVSTKHAADGATCLFAWLTRYGTKDEFYKTHDLRHPSSALQKSFVLIFVWYKYNR